MKISKDRNITDFSHLYKRNEKSVHSIKLVIDDIIIEVSKVILDWWTCQFNNFVDEDSEIFLTEFIGHKEQVLDCIELLYGHDVEVSFENIPIIIKFGNRFQIPELLTGAMAWLTDNMTKTSGASILKCIDLLSNLSTMGYQCDDLVKVIREFIEDNYMDFRQLVNQRKHDFFKQIDFKIMIDILLSRSYMVKQCLIMFRVHERKEKDFQYLLQKLEELLDGNIIAVVKNVEYINNFTEKVVAEVDNAILLKKWMTFTQKLTKVDMDYSLIPDSSRRLTVVTGKAEIKFLSWRTFSKQQLLEVRGKYDLSEVEYAMVCIDWVKSTNPENVDDIYSSVVLEKLEVGLAIEFEKALYIGRGIPRNTDKHGFYIHDFERQIWDITEKKALLDSINGVRKKNVTLNDTCDISSCTLKAMRTLPECYENYKFNMQFRDHLINLKFLARGNRVHVQVFNIVANPPHQHTHSQELYLHWYMVGYNGSKETDDYEFGFSSFYANAKEEIIKFIHSYETIKLVCVCKRCFEFS